MEFKNRLQSLQIEERTPTPFLIQTKVLKFEKVPLVKRRVVKTFTISNLTEEKLDVDIQCNLAEISFQIYNENEKQDESTCNELFNTINFINSITLKAKEEKTIYVLFLPPNLEKHTEKIFSFKDIYGTIRLSTGQFEEFIEVFAKVCKSHLEVDLTFLDFGDCILGKKYVRDFSIINRSELMSTIRISAPKSKCLEMSDYETGNKLLETLSIAGYSHTRISIVFCPSELGEYEENLEIRNQIDDTNYIKIGMRALSMKETQGTGFMVYNEQGSVISGLNFGECYSNTRNIQTVVLRNRTDESIDVSLGSQQSEEISFELLTDEIQETASPTLLPRLLDKENEKKIEEVSIPPGSSVRIGICYVPSSSEGNDAPMLKKREFRIVLKCKDMHGKEVYSKKIPAIAQVCTSIVEVSTNEINFGDCNIGTLRYSTVSIINRSELPAYVSFKFISHVITLNTREGKIPPKQQMELKVGFSPRKINPNYKKSLQVVNMKNEKNESSILIRANNNDGNMLTYHAEYYDVNTSSQHNYAKSINFYNMVVNDTYLHNFSIKSKKLVNLTIKTSQTDEMLLFVKNPNLILETKQKELILKRLAQLKYRRVIENMLKRSDDVTPQESPRDKTIPTDDLLNQFLDALLDSYLNPIPFATSTTMESSLEKVYAKYLIHQNKCLDESVFHKILIPIQNLSIPENTEVRVYIMFTPLNRPNALASLKRIEEKIYLMLQSHDEKEIPPRILSVQGKICLSIATIPQRNINFGEMLNTEEKKKTITLSNLSEVPLVYKFYKTGSLASGDLKLEQGNDEKVFGVLRPYGKRDVKIQFTPTLTGKYQEILTIKNVRDRTNNLVINVKATIKQPEKFTIKEPDGQFGQVLVDKKSGIKKIVIQNVSKSKIVFVLQQVENSFEKCEFEYHFEKETTTLPSEKSEKLESELEAHEHKLRIAVRKNKMEKTKELEERIEEIKKILSKMKGDTVQSEDEGPSDDEKSFEKIKRVSNQEIIFSVPGHSIVTILFAFTPKSSKNSLVESGNFGFVIYEKKNVDVKKKMIFSTTIKKMETKKIDNNPKFSTLQPQTSENLSLTPKSLDFGIINIGDTLKGSFTIYNSGSPTGFVILKKETQINFSQLSGQIEKFSSMTITFDFVPQSIGLQQIIVSIQNMLTKTEHEFLIRFSAQTPPPIDILLQGNVLDCGNCYCHPTKSWYQVQPLQITTIKENLFCTLESNTPSQIGIFTDESMTKKAEMIPLFNKNTFYIALKPYLNDYDKENGNCRSFVAGIKIKIFKDREKMIYQKVIKLKSLVGNSQIMVNPPLLDMGSTTEMRQVFDASIQLTHQNKTMPASFAITCLNQFVTKISPTSGTLNGTNPFEINLQFQSKQHGLNQDDIIIENLTNGQNICVPIRIFVDDKSLCTNLDKNNNGIDELVYNYVYYNPKENFVFSKELVLTNQKTERMELIPISDFGTLERDENTINKLVLEPGESCACRVVIQTSKLPTFTSRTNKVILGDIKFEENNTVIKVVSIHLNCCVSEGIITPDTSECKLGKFGYINQWEEIPFDCCIENMSDIPLCLTAKCPSVIQPIDLELIVPPRGCKLWNGVFLSKKYMEAKAELIHQQVKFVNKYNPSNQMTLNLYAQLVTCVWKFSRLEEKNIVLPVLHFPNENPVDHSFLITNDSKDVMDATFEVVTNPILENILTLDLLDHNTGIPIKTHKFLPETLFDIRVKLIVKPKSFIPKDIFESVITTERLTENSKVPVLTFGSIIVSSRDQPNEILDIVGSILQEDTFSLSTSKLFFEYKTNNIKSGPMDLMDTFTITNLTKIPLNFVVEPKIPENYGGIVRIIPEQGVIDASSSYTISVFVHFDKLDEKKIKFVVKDVLSPLSTQTLTSRVCQKEDLKIMEKSSPTVLLSPRLFDHFDERLTLKGCKVIGEIPFERYIIDMGQQNHLSTDEIEWDLTIENNSNKNVSWILYPMGNKPLSWVTLSHSEGTLKSKNDSQTVTMTFSTRELNNYTTYFVLQNLNDSSDIKMIRVNMEVVSSGMVSKNYFSVLVDEIPLEENSKIDLGEVFVGDMVRHHYLDIINLMDIPLEFNFTANLETSTTELHFSLSLTSLKSFHSLTVEAKSTTRIYLLYNPKNSSPIQELVEIFIKCRILKDYQERVVIQAKISQPQIRLSTQEVFFLHGDEKKTASVIVENNFKRILTYTIRTNSMYFDIYTPIGYITSENSNNTIKLAHHDYHTIIVRPKQDILDKMTGSYIEEHFTVYNKQNTREKMWVTMRFSRGMMKQFYVGPGSKTGYVFTMLEEQIVQFLTRFSHYCDNLILELAKSEDKPKMIQNHFSKESVKQLNFDLFYITDELVFYGMKGRVSHSFFDLARLLYSVIYKHKLFTLVNDQNIVKKWFGQLDYFLNFFPSKRYDFIIKDLVESRE